ncbi:hypothetical protein THASP1DRAFT_19859 [Thamnocephalis sphaerospora]|uniref:Uncharacterized protein n=1 Tax=Thamnocephalis sphaerospora TaxID=78915 RepID=A0A4P9XI86_9FUNG|nr:hypothetical protein THASP1DRAFT_19859 [Thamnocephalis sphaerospora]|eukprot:RKP05395.1 hypothetical protein THASP1DRAFT_19859 [Thamnocephalis sphaerospora]
MDVETDVRSSAEHNDADEVLCEFDVHFASGLAGQLHLLQHPVRLRRYGRGIEPTEAQYRPQANRLQFELPVNTSQQAYDADRGRELARAVGESQRSKKDENSATTARARRHGANGGATGMDLDESQSDPIMERVAIGSVPMPMMTNYMVGVLRNGKCRRVRHAIVLLLTRRL